MKGREFIFMVSGLVVGLLVGGILVASNSELNTLFGSAVGQNASYYLVDMAAAGDWLESSSATDADELSAALDTVTQLPDAENFRETFVEAQASTERVLSETYSLLGGEETTESIRTASVFACLGLDDNPYETGRTLSMYMKVPTNQTGSLPTEWEQLEGPREADLYWQLLACQPAADTRAK